MDLGLSTLIGAGANLIGGWYGGKQDLQATRESNAASAYEAMVNRQFQSDMMDKQAGINAATLEKQYAFNKEEAANARQWSEQMTSSAYQRAVADMKKAGINPMLAYSQGGAQTTGGQAASGGSMSVGMPSGSMPNVYKSQRGEMYSKAIQSAVNSALDTVRLKKDVEIADSVIKKNWAEKSKLDIENDLLDLTRPAVTAESEARKLNAMYESQPWYVSMQHMASKGMWEALSKGFIKEFERYREYEKNYRLRKEAEEKLQK